MRISQVIDSIPEVERTPHVLQLIEIILLQSEQIQALNDEIARLKGEKPKPKIKPSNLGKEKKEQETPNKPEKRPGSAKKQKTKNLEIHEDKIIKPDGIPEGSEFKGYQDYVVQGLIFRPHNIRYRLARWVTPDGKSIIGKLPDEVVGSHFSLELRCFILYQYYHAHVTEPLILEQLLDAGFKISAGQINNILIEEHDRFHAEKEEILQIGIEVSEYLNVDDTGARHNGKNGYCTHIGNEFFACFESTESKSRINFLKVLRGAFKDYVLNPDAIAYMGAQNLPQKHIHQLCNHLYTAFQSDQEWYDHLTAIGIVSPRHVQIATEGALVGSVVEHGVDPSMVIVSDDAGQFNLFCHALCWIHAERSINKLVGFSDEQREALEEKRSQIWEFYRTLKEYKEDPAEMKKEELRARFDDIFTEKTCFTSLNLALGRIYGNKDELLLVLERPEIPLHNNLSEGDIRDFVKWRKISGSTRSPTGRRCRDTFTSLKKTCRKLGISFWEYLKDRLGGSERKVPYLPDLIRSRASEESA